MKALKLSKDVITLAEFKNSAADYLKQLNEQSHPFLITQNGKPAGVLLSPAEYDRIQEKQTILFLESVEKGIQDADNNNVLDSESAKVRLGLK